MIHSAGVAEWGLKDIADLEKAAHEHALTLSEKVAMPANYFGLSSSGPEHPIPLRKRQRGEYL